MPITVALRANQVSAESPSTIIAVAIEDDANASTTPSPGTAATIPTEEELASLTKATIIIEPASFEPSAPLITTTVAERTSDIITTEPVISIESDPGEEVLAADV